MCDRWHSFECFLADMGAKPEGMSLDRIDNSRGYSPDNCRWATRKEQAVNRRSTVFVRIFGETMSVRDASRRLGLSDSAIWQTIYRTKRPAQDVVSDYEAGRIGR